MTSGGIRHYKVQFVAGFRLGAKTDHLERMFAPKKRRRSAKAKSRKKAERDALHGVLLNVWRKYARPPLARRCSLLCGCLIKFTRALASAYAVGLCRGKTD